MYSHFPQGIIIINNVGSSDLVVELDTCTVHAYFDVIDNNYMIHTVG